jgi:LPS-assembly protein
MLRETTSAPERNKQPTFLFGDLMTGRPDLEFVLQGQVEMRRGQTVIKTDRLEYDQIRDLAKAIGSVRVNQAGNVYEGPRLELRVDTFEGVFEKPSYQFLLNGAHGVAEQIDFLDEKRAVIRNSTFTTCKRQAGPSWLPDWMLKTSRLRIDTDDQVGEADDAQLSFKGIPLIAAPSISFSLSDQRKSGVLSPVFGVDSLSGTQLTTPYYWNIAPNRDATVTPTIMSKRGMNLGSEFRYLENSYNGRLRADYLPSDQLRQSDRWGLGFLHQGHLQTGSPYLGNLGVMLNINRVSDDNYWRDFPGTNPSLTQRLLPSDATVSWAKGEYAASVRALKWQVLQDTTSTIGRPYDRLPQLTAKYTKLDLAGWDLGMDGDLTQFQAATMLLGAPTMLNASGASVTQPNAQRNVWIGHVSRPLIGAAGYISPKLQWHATSYQFDTALPTNGASSATRAVPTFSLDSVLVLERKANFSGMSFTQTLEPRLFYVNTPYVYQGALPNYDSGANDFNFASIFSENAYAGHDRIADNNLLTAGVTTRLLNQITGAEMAKFALAQRLRFSDQLVTLPSGTVAKEGVSDILLGAGVNLDQRWLLDSTVQYNPKEQKSVRSTVGARYHPGNYRVLNLAYRLQRDVSELADVGWQWPIATLGRGAEAGGRWYSVGRLNYSLLESRAIDTLMGFEYDAGCWVGRVVLERISTGLISSSAERQYNARLMLQLEFVGLSRVGIDPLSRLKQTIPRYQMLNEQNQPISRYTRYD